MTYKKERQTGHMLALKWVVYPKSYAHLFIQHSLSACHEKAPAEARLPKAIRVLPQELSNRREKSHMATEGLGPLCSKGRTSSGPHPTTVHAEAWVRIGHHIFGEQGHI